MRTTSLRWPWWLGGFAAWTLLALLSSAERALWLVYRDLPIPWGQITVFSLADWYACGLFIPLLLVATRRRVWREVCRGGCCRICGIGMRRGRWRR